MSEELQKFVVGYCDPISVRPGESIRFFASHTRNSESVDARVELVELICGDDRPHGSGFQALSVKSDLPETVALHHQSLRPGSFGRVEQMPSLDTYELTLHYWPTLLRQDAQTLVDMAGVCLSVDTDGLLLGSHRLRLPLRHRRWHAVTLTEAGIRCRITAGGVGELDYEIETTFTAPVQLVEGAWLFAARSEGEQHFNGRLESPTVHANGELIAGWDFAQELSRSIASDTSGEGRDLCLYQSPTRGVAGRLWDGSVRSYHEAPTQYGAAHFHEDDLTDAQWSPTLSLQIPEGLRSGQYALRFEVGDTEDYVPFFVRPPVGQRTSDVAYLVPTATYLAYANQRVLFSGGIFGAASLKHANEVFLYHHEEVGYSMYEYHRDGSGVHFSSRLRPVLNLKPRSGTWAFNADTHITAWLHEINQPFDVVTDEDLHLEGEAALAGYRVVITGSHPEYYSTQMRDGLENWLGGGGRLMYMGGNGFYWRVAFDPENPAIMEVRRAEGGTRAWMSEPGEYYHQFSGEYGGLWRNLGRPPNTLVGIGFAAQGFDGGTYYELAPGALDPRVAFAVEGLAEGAHFGAYGVQGGGAAGEEIDRVDERLGSPAHAVVIASSREHKPGMLRVVEEHHMMAPPRADDPQVRADMTFFETPSGGAVFSTGSISYTGSLCHNDYDNDVARLTGNVLRRFLDSQPFAYPEEG